MNSTFFKTIGLLMLAIIGKSFAQSTATWRDHVPAHGVTIPAAGNAIVYSAISRDVNSGETLSLTNDKYWYVAKNLHVRNGGTLTVQKGAWIFLGVGTDSSSTPRKEYGVSIIVMQGGKIFAEGTVDSPIVMTGVGDDPRDIASFGAGFGGSWGGLIICGRAPASGGKPSANPPFWPSIKGLPANDTVYYGGTNSNDNSGRLEYLSIRHAGFSADDGQGNSITFAGVGSGTLVEYVETFSSYGNGFRWLGGTVNGKHLASTLNYNDAFKVDEGYSGKCQFLFGALLGAKGMYCFEGTGKHITNGVMDSLPSSSPTIFNATFINAGMNTIQNSRNVNPFCMVFSDSMGGLFKNIICIDGPQKALGRRVDDVNVGMARSWGIGLEMQSSILYNFGAGGNWGALVSPQNDSTYFMQPNNKDRIADPFLRGISNEYFFPALDPRPAIGSPCFNQAFFAIPPNDGFFDVSGAYIGAFDTLNLWCDKWTKLSQAGILTKTLTMYPVNEVLQSTANIDFMMMLNTPGIVPINAQVLLDGSDITSIALPIIINNSGALNCGGTWFKIPGVSASVFGTQYFPGLHILETDFQLSNGQIVKEKSSFKIE